MSEHESSSGGAKKAASAGVGFGTVLATVISYTAWHSIPWAIFHGILGWVYVLYYAIKYGTG